MLGLEGQNEGINLIKFLYVCNYQINERKGIRKTGENMMILEQRMNLHTPDSPFLT